MHKDEDQMKKAANLVSYEWGQFSWAASVLHGTEEPYIGTGTGEAFPSEDAVVEVLLLHARALRDFFGRIRPLPQRSESDILAADFFDPPTKWTNPGFSYLAEK